MNIVEIIAKEFNVKKWQIESVIKLLDDGNTIPFIARYRKEATGSLNDEILRAIHERLKYLNNLQDKKNTVIQTIMELDKLTEELSTKIENCLTLVELEDIYRPYKPKRKTKASVAIDAGLSSLVEFIFNNKPDNLEKEATKYICDLFPTEKNVIDGVKDIVAQIISDDAEIRQYIRREITLTGQIKSVGKSEDGVYANYNDYEENIRNIPSHRILAINRGEKEKELTISLIHDVESITKYIYNKFSKGEDNCLLYEAVADSYKRLIYPSIEREIRNQLTENAHIGAIEVFKNNLKQLLMQPPIAGKTVLGWDPAFRTGCKLAVISGTGQVLDTLIIYPTKPQNKIDESKKVLDALVKKYNIDVISLGNGTASRESEKVIVEFIKEYAPTLNYIITNEAGASVYSASDIATKEFKDLSEGARSAISIARRIQDPLAELVKIDPKSIGVGQYQHDMNQKQLSEALDGVVNSCVNNVGADLNTASVALLENISGLTKSVCKNIVDYRDKIGRYKNRKQLLDVAKLGPKMFEQCAGFLRILGGDEPLDKTAIHPQNYEHAYKILENMGYSREDLLKNTQIKLDKNIDIKSMSINLNLGEITIKDILTEFEKPSRDPREDMPKPILKSDVLSIEDLKVGMTLKGCVRNVIDFGVFVDIGVHEDGMVHISELSNKFIKHPLDLVKVGDVVNVTIIDIDKKRNRIALSMKC